MREDTPTRATDRKGRVRAGMAADLLDRASRGELRVAVGRASDYYGPYGTATALGENFFAAALRGRTVNAVGSLDAPHTMSYLPDVAAGLLTLAERDGVDGRVWHLPVAEPLTTRQFADLVAGKIGRPVKLRGAGVRTLRLLGLAVPMMRELAGVADRAFRTAFPDAVRVTAHLEAVAATIDWWSGRLATAAA